MLIDETLINPPTEPTEDKVHRLVRATLGALPLFSGTAVELLNALIEPPIERRRSVWMEQVTVAINEIHQRLGIDLENFKNNEEFISILIQASQIALKNHQTEKLELLRNVLVNSFNNGSLSTDKKFTFLHLLDQYTPTHILLLEEFKKGCLWVTSKTNNFNSNYETAKSLSRKFEIPNLSNQFIYQVISDLDSKKLLHMMNLGRRSDIEDNGVTGSSEYDFVVGLTIEQWQLEKDQDNYYTCLSQLGSEFLDFISSSWCEPEGTREHM